MLGLAALALAASSASSSVPLASAMPWWEKLTFTMTGSGSQQACSFESSLPTATPQSCADDGSAAPVKAAEPAGAAYTKITIERRFAPNRPDAAQLEAGETLLGQQVMSLVIDAKGKVRSCSIVDSSGDMKPPYGCDDVTAERFDASAGRGARQLRQGYMTVRVYGHEEYPA